MLVFVTALLGALVPTVIYIQFVWWLDHFEKEPFWLLILAFVWGAVPAAILSVGLELLFDLPVYALGGESLAANLISVSVGAPLIEESCKGIALLGLLLICRREFDDVLDGIVYGALIGFGFAFSENLFAYFLPILSTQGFSAGLTNIFMRSVVFGFNHAFWTGIVGAAVGYARLSASWDKRIGFPIAGWTLAVLLHAIHNTGATLIEQTICLSFVVSSLVTWGGGFLLLLVAISILRRESGWIQRGLQVEVQRGTLTEREFDLLSSASQRLWVRWQALNRGGRRAHKAVGRYYQCATKLAFTKQHLRTLGNEGGNLEKIQHLQNELATCRAEAWPWLWPPSTWKR